jgi:hypothetical protein
LNLWRRFFVRLIVAAMALGCGLFENSSILGMHPRA